jgi:prepilin-type processing-associated H-X9-DG protein
MPRRKGGANGEIVMDEIIFTDPVTPLFLKPDQAGEMADEALYGMAADIMAEERGMLKIKMRYRYEGYVDAKVVTRTDSAGKWEGSVTHQAIAPFADIMACPSYQSHVVKTLPRGGRLSSCSLKDNEDAEWIPATLADGTSGYVRARSVRPVNVWAGTEEKLRESVAADAMLYFGAQYRWGGKSPCGIDCSGLASMAYMLNGLYIYRDAKIMDGFPVTEIPAEDAGVGDLLFWDGHVAIYLGNRRYIHSTGRSSGVVLNSLDPVAPDFREDLAEVKKWGSVFKKKG